MRVPSRNSLPVDLEIIVVLQRFTFPVGGAARSMYTSLASLKHEKKRYSCAVWSHQMTWNPSNLPAVPSEWTHKARYIRPMRVLRGLCRCVNHLGAKRCAPSFLCYANRPPTLLPGGPSPRSQPARFYRHRLSIPNHAVREQESSTPLRVESRL